MPTLLKCFETEEARRAWLDAEDKLFHEQIQAIEWGPDQAARDRAKANVEALAKLRGQALLLPLCPLIIEPTGPGSGALPTPPPNPTPPPKKEGPKTGSLTPDELDTDPDWPRRRAAIEKRIEEKNKQGRSWLERDWFDWLFEQSGRPPSAPCPAEGSAACMISPLETTDAQLKILADDHEIRVNSLELSIETADNKTAGVPKPSEEIQKIEEKKQPSWWETLIPALIPEIGVGGRREDRERRFPDDPRR
jgi:hypothetical protein